MHIAAEMGLSGLLILFGTLGMWLWQGVRKQISLYHWWGYAVLLVLGIHSMLEYPLWYSYFMGIAAILLGVMDGGIYRLEMRLLGRIYIVILLLLGALSLIQLQLGYNRLERALSPRQKIVEGKTTSQLMRDGLVKVHGYPLMQPFAELFFNNWIDISPEELDKKISLNERAMKFVPLSSVVYRRAYLLAISNRQDEATLQMEQAIWSYPVDFPSQMKELSELERKDPEHFSSLLKFAVQKNEEYISAVSTK